MRHMRAINAAQMTEGGGFRNDPPALSIRTEWFENNTGEQLLAFQVQKGSLFQRGVGHLSARRPVLPSSRRPEVRRRSTLEAASPSVRFAPGRQTVTGRRRPSVTGRGPSERPTRGCTRRRSRSRSTKRRSSAGPYDSDPGLQRDERPTEVLSGI